MMTKIYCAAAHGIAAELITVEVNVSPGIRYYIVGLPDVAVRESLQRIEHAVTASGRKMPRQKVVVNLAPAYLRKSGSAFDLGIALGIMGASGQIDPDLFRGILFVGELSLDGGLLPVRGVLSIALMAKEQGFSRLVVPSVNAAEAAVVEGIGVYGMEDLRTVMDFLEGGIRVMPWQAAMDRAPGDFPGGLKNGSPMDGLDFSDVSGQAAAKRALEVAVAGGHNILLIGPPGSGKSMLARLLPTIMPPLSREEALETTRIYSAAGKLVPGQALMIDRPFRAPHHTITAAALIGGGAYPQPGEISLAHHGILFLDELPEFRRPVLEVLRQPLESRTITLSRSGSSVELPADVMLVTAMNFCPCGLHGHPSRVCSCGPRAIRQYIGRISGPLLDRIDLHIQVAPVGFPELSHSVAGEDSATIRGRVSRARQRQQERFWKRGSTIGCNARMDHRQVREYCRPDAPGQELLRTAMERLSLSARAYDRILKVARTIADLAGTVEIGVPHLAEAIQYRSLDRKDWI